MALAYVCDRNAPIHVWSYDFVQDRTADESVYWALNIIDEYTREALMIRVDCKLNSTDGLDALTDLFFLRGPPEYMRSDNGPAFSTQKVRDWIAAVGAKTAYIEPGSPLENGYGESFDTRFRDALLNSELFYSLREAQLLIEQWRNHYNTKRLHGALGTLSSMEFRMKTTAPAIETLAVSTLPLDTQAQPENSRSNRP